MEQNPKNLSEVMTQGAVTVEPNLSLQDALEVMRSWGMRHLPVVDEKNQVIGLISDRDIYRYMALQPTKKLVADAMSTQPFTVKGGERLAAVVKMMANNKYGCAIVCDLKGEVTGIFTTTDALFVLSRLLETKAESEPEFRLMSLEEYLVSWQGKKTS